jgi:hypothetical protein
MVFLSFPDWAIALTLVAADVNKPDLVTATSRIGFAVMCGGIRGR